jgi:hypothetical protein
MQLDPSAKGGSPAQLTLTQVHGQGPCSHTFALSEGVVRAITAGADGRVTVRSVCGVEELTACNAVEGPVHALAADPNNAFLAIADDQFVKVIQYLYESICNPSPIPTTYQQCK